jgi:RNA polymerase sigma-70 factor (ECF subfamily)
LAIIILNLICFLKKIFVKFEHLINTLKTSSLYNKITFLENYPNFKLKLKGSIMANLQIPDALLVKNYVEGNENALSTLIKRHESKIYGFIYSKIADKDISNDIFQDTFIKVIKTLKSNSYNEEGKFLPWVMRISHNLIVDHYRKTKKMPMYRETEEFSIFSIMSDDTLTIENKMIVDQVEVDLKKLIEELPCDQKEVLVMRMYQDMSFKEISEVTGVSINTALGRMRYALMNIRKIIEKHQIILTN